MTDSFHHITESSENKLKNKGSKHTHLAKEVSHVLEFLRRNTSVQCFDLCRHENLSHTCVRQENS